MNYSDKELGMDRTISRRDFLNGAAAITAVNAMPGGALASSHETAEAAAVGYPPGRTGSRGSHPGSYEAAHDLVWQGRQDWGSVRDAESGVYDLVVVGAGISGLAAAHFYRNEHPDARILILDNHDDFGGHAKRNEFELDGRTILSYGGAQILQDPARYSAITKGLLTDLGIDTKRFHSAYDHEFFRRNGLAGATYFDSATFGSDRLVRYPLMDYTNFLPLATSSLDAKEAVAQMPLGDSTRRELLQLLEARGNRLSDIPAGEQQAYLWRLSYRDFLERHMGVTDPGVFALYQGLVVDSSASIEVSAALSVMGYSGFPGLQATALSNYEDVAEPYIFHFPDGNASIARLLVRNMIPQVAAGSTMDDIVLTRFDYSKLDEKDASVRLRLNSMVVRVEHEGSHESSKQVSVNYVKDGAVYRVHSKHCVMAGYNAMIPYICPELPAVQQEALAFAIKSPIVYTSVLLRNWRAWKILGMGFFASPGSYYAVSMLDFPVSMGGYSFSANPDEPIIVHMERFAVGDNPDATPREQRLAGRRELFATPYETIERETRRQLAGALVGGGFDPAKDIAGITVNRWGHGYSYRYNPKFDSGYKENEYPHIVGRQRFGRITIANSDAGASANIIAAIDQAHRATQELLKES
jgi:spermidine dehydrogenase